MKKNGISQITLLILSVFIQESVAASAQGLYDSAKIYLMEQRYREADRIVQSVLTENPADMEALYLGIAILQTEILDYESYDKHAKSFRNRADSVLTVLLENLPLQKGKDSLDCLFYAASVLGGIGVMNAKTGYWPAAISKALSSVKYLKHIVQRDSSYAAGYLGIGVFNYYLSRNLKWLPFFSDKRVEAIGQIRRAIRSEFPFNYAACNSLCWILLERNEVLQTDSIVSSVVLIYPDNTLFVRIKIRVDLARSKWSDVIPLAQKLIALSLKRDPINWSDIVSGYQALVYSYEMLNRRTESLDAANEILAMPIPDDFRNIPFVKKYLKYVKEIRDKYGLRPSLR